MSKKPAARHLRDERVEALFEKHPSLAQIDARRREAVLDKFRFRRLGNQAAALEQEKHIAELDKQFKAELKQAQHSSQPVRARISMPKMP